MFGTPSKFLHTKEFHMLTVRGENRGIEFAPPGANAKRLGSSFRGENETDDNGKGVATSDHIEKLKAQCIP